MFMGEEVYAASREKKEMELETVLSVFLCFFFFCCAAFNLNLFYEPDELWNWPILSVMLPC